MHYPTNSTLTKRLKTAEDTNFKFSRF